MSVARGGYNKGLIYSNIVSPIKIDCNFVVDSTNGNGLGIRSLKSNGYIQNVYMNTSATPATGNPNPAAGLALIHFKQNFNYYLGGFSGFVSPVTGSNVHINSTSLTVGNPYIITAVGAVPAPHFTMTAVADSSGNLAGKYWTFADQFNNNYVVWYVVSGVGVQPSLTGALLNYIPIQVSIATNDTNSTVGGNTRTALAAASNVTITGSTSSIIVTGNLTTTGFSNLPSAGTSGFTAGAITYTTLQADWNIVGLPPGFTPNVGASFIAAATGDGGLNSTGTVKAPGTSGIFAVEVVGDANQLISNQNIAANSGAWVMVQFLNASGAETAPAAGSVVGMSFFFDQSSVTIDGL